MKTIKFNCPHCTKRLAADASAAGQTGTCPDCNNSVTIPSLSVRSFRDAFPTPYTATDGHRVRSRAELIIDNWLYARRIPHAYEYMVPTDEEMYCDFYLPDGDVYIEYWGLRDDARYSRRMEDKQRIYSDNELNLIELSDMEIERLDDTLPKLLRRFMDLPSLRGSRRTVSKKEIGDKNMNEPCELLERMAIDLGKPIEETLRREVDNWLGKARIALDSNERKNLFRAWRTIRRSIRDKQLCEPESWKTRSNNQGLPWSTDEDQNLCEAVSKRKTIAKIAAYHKRSEGSIRARIERLGLEDEAQNGLESPVAPFTAGAPVTCPPKT